MPGLRVQATCRNIQTVRTDALVVGFHEDVRPLKGLAGELDWLLCGALSHLLIGKKLQGSTGDMALLTSRGKVPQPKIFMVGLGPKSDYSLSTLRSVVRTASAGVVKAGAGSAAIECLLPPDASPDDILSAYLDGLSEGVSGRSLDVTLITSDQASCETLSRLMTTRHQNKPVAAGLDQPFISGEQ